MFYCDCSRCKCWTGLFVPSYHVSQLPCCLLIEIPLAPSSLLVDCCSWVLMIMFSSAPFCVLMGKWGSSPLSQSSCPGSVDKCYDWTPQFSFLLYFLVTCHVIIMWSLIWLIVFVMCIVLSRLLSVTFCPGNTYCSCDWHCSRYSIVLVYYKY